MLKKLFTGFEGDLDDDRHRFVRNVSNLVDLIIVIVIVVFFVAVAAVVVIVFLFLFFVLFFFSSEFRFFSDPP